MQPEHAGLGIIIDSCDWWAASTATGSRRATIKLELLDSAKVEFHFKEEKKSLSKGNLHASALKQGVSQRTGGWQFGFI